MNLMRVSLEDVTPVTGEEEKQTDRGVRNQYQTDEVIIEKRPLHLLRR